MLCLSINQAKGATRQSLLTCTFVDQESLQLDVHLIYINVEQEAIGS